MIAGALSGRVDQIANKRVAVGILAINQVLAHQVRLGGVHPVHAIHLISIIVSVRAKQHVVEHQLGRFLMRQTWLGLDRRNAFDGSTRDGNVVGQRLFSIGGEPKTKGLACRALEPSGLALHQKGKQGAGHDYRQQRHCPYAHEIVHTGCSISPGHTQSFTKNAIGHCKFSADLIAQKTSDG